ncbi:MAG: response regulator [Planctomycetes bacterium]|nr:response regulator [Planctomycetota bacterium]
MAVRPRVLVIDDNHGFCQVVQTLLDGEGFQVCTSGHWLDAMKTLEAEPPDAIILDLMLPDVDGFEILDWLRKSDRFKELPVVVCSALSSREDVERARKGGASEVVTKPCRPLDLADALRRWVKPITPS